MNIPHCEPKLTSIPEVPKEFGEDGGQFYKYYDTLAEELDEDMVKSLKAQLDGILIFAGLFAGANSAFLALTLPEMKADPADNTNALLLTLVNGVNNSIRAEDLPSSTFTPPPGILPVNILFSLSLTLAIISSFIAVLGQQWLVYYRKQSGGGAEYQRREQLRRYLGAQRWRLEAILDDVLPTLLQLALVIFCVAFVLYLRTLSKTIYYVIVTPIAVAMAILLLMAIIAFLDQWCPFKSPLSRFLHLTGQLIDNYWQVRYLMILLLYFPWLVAVSIVYIILRGRQLARALEIFVARRVWNHSQVPSEFRPPWQGFMSMASDLVERASDPRSEERIAYLLAVAAKRVICTSEEFNALIYAATNIQAMTELESARCLLDDDVAYKRLDELSRSREEALATVFSRALPHLLLGSQSAEFFVEREYRELYSSGKSYPRMYQYVEEPHPLKKRITSIRHQLDASVRSLHTDPNDLAGLLLYFELLELLLDEGSGNRDFGKWFDHVIEKYPASKAATPLVLRLVARTVCILHEGLESALPPPKHSIPLSTDNYASTQTQQRSPEKDRYLTVQQQRVEAVKILISSDGWDVRGEEEK
ncbi:hypothetical protein FRC00_005333 [Tulasnella sp. 408]|nr:hypothetical protein FRC00_005333 [Tulasnella sp. 408]